MITFLKLGGSVITEKSKPMTARLETIRRLAAEIAQALAENPELHLLLGHGSGSFGHVPAAVHSTHLGASSPEDWHGFVEVWQAARELNTIIVDELRAQDLPAISFPPSTSAISEGGKLYSITHEPIQRALAAGLLPVVYGDVVFDRLTGASIASTEAIFALLTQYLNPERLLLAGLEAGVYANFWAEREPLEEITPASRAGLRFGSPEGEDVTGGMRAKVDLCLSLAQSFPDLEIRIFSVEQPGVLASVLSGGKPGTRVRV